MSRRAVEETQMAQKISIGLGMAWVDLACVAWQFCRASRFLCPRPPLLLCAPNQNRHATQARVAYKKTYDPSLVDYQMFTYVWSSRENAQVIGKEYGSVENGTNGRSENIMHC